MTQQLWEPQEQALKAIQRSYAQSEELPPQPQIIQIPTGCGKSTVIALLPLYLPPQQEELTILVVVPTVALVEQTKQAICTAFRRHTSPTQLSKLTVHTIESVDRLSVLLNQRRRRVEEKYRFLVCNIHKLHNDSKHWWRIAPLIDVVAIDEAHHIPAAMWQRFLYDKTRLGGKVKRQLLCTATPFRSDQRPLTGELCFSYPYRRAIEQGFIRHPVIHCRKNGDDDAERRDLELLQRTQLLLGDGEQAIGYVKSVKEAERIAEIARQHTTELSVGVWHCRMSKAEQEGVRQRFEQEQSIKLLLQVKMCAEGYDHPPVKVVVFFRVVRSPLFFVQAIGRAARRTLEQRQRDESLISHIVGDERLNSQKLWLHFKQHADDFHIEKVLAETAAAIEKEEEEKSLDEEQLLNIEKKEKNDLTPPVEWWINPFDCHLFSALFSTTTTTTREKRSEPTSSDDDDDDDDDEPATSPKRQRVHEAQRRIEACEEKIRNARAALLTYQQADLQLESALSKI